MSRVFSSALIFLALNLASAAWAFDKGTVVLVQTDSGIHKGVILEVRDKAYRTSVTGMGFVNEEDLQGYLAMASMRVKTIGEKVASYVTTADGTLYSVGDQVLVAIAGIKTKVRILDITSTGLVQTNLIDSYFNISELSTPPLQNGADDAKPKVVDPK